MASEAKLGSGKRFEALESKLSGEKNPPKNPAAVAASIGRSKLGKKKMTKLATAGKKRAAKKK